MSHRTLFRRASATEPRTGNPQSKLWTWGIRATLLISERDFSGDLAGLENERGEAFKAGQDGRCGIEKRPIPEIAM